MSKRLVVTYGDAVLYDDTPESVTFTDGTSFELKAGPETGILSQLLNPQMLQQLAQMGGTKQRGPRRVPSQRPA